MKYILYHIKQIFKQVFTYPVSEIHLTEVDYDRYWDDKRGDQFGTLSRWQRKRVGMVVEHLKSEKEGSIVDVGCGDGSMLKYIKEHSSISRVIGVDVSESALKKAEESGLETIHFDINDGNFDKIPNVDFALFFEVLEHIPNSELFLKTMLEKTERGVFFSFPNSGYFIFRLRLLFGKFPMQWRIHPGEHLRFWTYADLRWWLKALGYTDYIVRTYAGIPLLNRVWPSMFAAGLFVYLPKK